MSTISFSEFNTTTKNDWYNQAIKDLKGKSFDETLVWKLQEGFEVQPYFSIEDLDAQKVSAVQKAQSRGSKTGWQNRPTVMFVEEKETNQLIISTLQAGADAVTISFGEAEISGINFLQLLNNVKLSETPIFFKSNQPQKIFSKVSQFINYQPKGGLTYDFLSNYFAGKIASVEPSTWENTKDLIEKTTDFPHFSVVSIGSHTFHNAGANATQELAFTLNSAVEYVSKLTDLGMTAEQIISKIEFSFSIGTNYFLEIAKIRAFRFLWQKITSEFGVEAIAKIQGSTSYFYDAAATPNTNMLRATTEAMSAVIGGYDSLTIHPYDAVFQQPNDFSERIARNISHLLKEESYLDKTEDASAGSYYIEHLTIALIDSAWELFKKVEAKGGIMQAFESGFIRSEIDESFEAKKEALQNGKIMVGVNKFRFDEKPIALQKTKQSISEKSLPNRRISEIFE